jgi:hypothetical protein
MMFTTQSKRKHLQHEIDEVSIMMEMFSSLFTQEELEGVSAWNLKIEDAAQGIIRSVQKN